ncbi:MAG: TMEM165/GDT1 family protein [Halobacteriota archaeon]
MIPDILIPLVTVGLAELGDKTQLAIFCLASRTKKYLQLLLGVTLGFAIADGLAIILGDFLTTVIPTDYIKIGAGVIFILFGILTLLNKEESEEICDLKKPFMSGFIMVLITEMGDKTQIAAGLFATKFDPILVFVAVMAALIALSAMAIFLGKIMVTKINQKVISILAGAIFIIIGVGTLIGLV